MRPKIARPPGGGDHNDVVKTLKKMMPFRSSEKIEDLASQVLKGATQDAIARQHDVAKSDDYAVGMTAYEVLHAKLGEDVINQLNGNPVLAANPSQIRIVSDLNHHGGLPSGTITQPLAPLASSDQRNQSGLHPRVKLEGRL